MIRFNPRWPVLLAAAVASAAHAQPIDLRGTGDAVPAAFRVEAPAGSACATGSPDLIVHDDGTAENAYGFGSAAVEGRMVQKFTPRLYPRTFTTVCIALLTNRPDVGTLDFDLVVYDDDGPGGAPGTLLASKPAQADVVEPPSYPIAARFAAFDIADLDLRVADGSVYIGARWQPGTQPGRYVAADESLSTPLSAGYTWANADPWMQMGVDLYPLYRAQFIRAVEAAPGAPTPALELAFTPSTVLDGQSATLTITLDNPVAETATLSAALVDPLPDGLVVAAPSQAATTCEGGTVDAAAGTSTITLTSGAQIPAVGSCTVSVRVRPDATGRYVNTLASGALRTDRGDNLYAAEASLTVNPAGGPFPAPYCAIGFADGVEPISRVAIAGIDHRSSAAIGAAGALEDFTAIAGAVETGAAYAIEVEGNTHGGFSNHVRAFADWNRNGVFEAEERYDLGILAPSSGEDAVRVRAIVPVPHDAYTGATRLRVVKRWGGYADPCGAGGYGQAEDYTLSISAGAGQHPVASFVPAALSFRVPSNQTASQSLTIANAAGAQPLDYALSGSVPAAFPLESAGGRGATATRLADGMRFLAFAQDDGSYETSWGYNDTMRQLAAVWLNRYAAPAGTGPYVIDSISVLWPGPAMAEGDLIGKQINLVAYYDANADGDVADAVRLGGDRRVAIGRTEAFERYAVDFEVPGDGDVYVGFFDEFALGGTTPLLWSTAIDVHAPQIHDGYLSGNTSGDADVDVLANNDETGPIGFLSGGGRAGSWMIRATGRAEGGTGPCQGAAPAWLALSPAAGTVAGGTTAAVTVRVNPSASALAEGRHRAELCAVTNDPTHASVMIPIEVEVLAPFEPCIDTVFANGFDAAGGGACRPRED